VRKLKSGGRCWKIGIIPSILEIVDSRHDRIIPVRFATPGNRDAASD
jgi:hypothetical protein